MSPLPRIELCEPLGLFVCVAESCGSAFSLQHIEGHLRRKHSVSPALAKAERERLGRENVATAVPTLGARYLHDPYPREGESPLPALPLLPIFRVLKCPFCSIYFRSSKVCKTHSRSAHAAHVNLKYELVKIRDEDRVNGQTLYTGPRTLYFPVAVNEDISIPPTNSEHVSLYSSVCAALFPIGNGGYFDIAERTAHCDKALPLSASNLGIQTFLSKRGISCDDAFEMTRMGPETHRSVTSVMVDYIQYFAKLDPPVPASVVESIKIRDARSQESFTLELPIDTQKHYARVRARFAVATAKLSFMRRTIVVVPEAVLYYAKIVTEEDAHPEIPKLTATHMYQRSLLLGAVRASRRETVALEEIFKLIIAGFSRSDSNSRARMGATKDASHTAAALQYFCHTVALGEFLAKPYGFGETTGSTDLSEQTRLRAVQEMTSTELCTPAAFIRNVLLKTKRLSCAEAPKVRFAVCSQHFYCGSVDNIEIQMNSSSIGSLGYAVRSIQRDALQLLRDDVMQNFDIPGGLVETILSFPDNISAKQHGYFFGNHQKSAALMSGWASSFAVHLRTGTNPIIRNDNAKSSCRFQPSENAGKWLAKVDKLSNLLYVLVHICGGGPPRLTEMNSARFRNTSAGQRNLFLYKRCLCIMVSYSKTNVQFQKATPIARFLDSSTIQLLLFLIVFY